MSEQNSNGSAQPRGNNGFVGGFVAGAIAGAILAYVVMQEDARDLIVGKAREAQNMAMDATDDLRDLYKRGKDVVDSARSNISAAVDEVQSASENLRDRLSRESDEMADGPKAGDPGGSADGGRGARSADTRI